MERKYVYLFNEGNCNMRELLGGKGANLAEMTNLRTSCSSEVLLLLQRRATIIMRATKRYLMR